MENEYFPQVQLEREIKKTGMMGHGDKFKDCYLFMGENGDGSPRKVGVYIWSGSVHEGQRVYTFRYSVTEQEVKFQLGLPGFNQLKIIKDSQVYGL